MVLFLPGGPAPICKIGYALVAAPDPGASSDGGASVFSQRSAATKSSSASKSTKGGAAQILTGKSGGVGIPRSTIEGSAFVIPAQEVRLYFKYRYSSDSVRKSVWPLQRSM